MNRFFSPILLTSLFSSPVFAQESSKPVIRCEAICVQFGSAQATRPPNILQKKRAIKVEGTGSYVELFEKLKSQCDGNYLYKVGEEIPSVLNAPAPDHNASVLCKKIETAKASRPAASSKEKSTP